MPVARTTTTFRRTSQAGRPRSTPAGFRPARSSAAGNPWRSRFDAERNVITVNGGHRDFVFAIRQRVPQLRYRVLLYVKDLVPRSFAGLPAGQRLERMVKLLLYAEEKSSYGR